MNGAVDAVHVAARRTGASRFGLHTFRVRAIDPTGNVDPTPAVRTWRITRP